MITQHLERAAMETDESTRLKLFFDAGRKWATDQVASGPFSPAFFAIKGQEVIPLFANAAGLENRYDLLFDGGRIIASANRCDCAILITYRSLRASGPPRDPNVCMDFDKFTCAMVYVHLREEKHVKFYPVGWGDGIRRLCLLPPTVIPHDVPDMVPLLAFPEYAEVTSAASREVLARDDLDWEGKVERWQQKLEELRPPSVSGS
jgi:hypothetical protein